MNVDREAAGRLWHWLYYFLLDLSSEWQGVGAHLAQVPVVDTGLSGRVGIRQRAGYKVSCILMLRRRQWVR